MRPRIYRQWIDSPYHSGKVFARKLVVEDEVLFDDEEYHVRVSAVAYSLSESGAQVSFWVHQKGVGHYDLETVTNKTALMAAADLGPDTLRLFLFRVWEAAQG